MNDEKSNSNENKISLHTEKKINPGVKSNSEIFDNYPKLEQLNNNSVVNNKINFKLTKSVIDEDFQILGINDLPKLSNYSNCNNKKEEKETKGCLVRSSVKIEIDNSYNSDNSNGLTSHNISNNSSPSIWTSLSYKLSNMKNNLIYNIITTNKYVDFAKLKYVKLFDSVFVDEQLRTLYTSSFLSQIFQFTYRSDFAPIIFNNVTYTSDCGWGCMIRAGQMLLSKAILGNKIHLFNSQTQYKYYLSEEMLNSLKYETLLLFFDNNLKIEDVLEKDDFEVFFQNYRSILQEHERKMKQGCPSEKEGKDDMILTSYDMFMRNLNENPLLYVSEVTPPFSIQNICKLAINYGKGPGIWFSDVIICEIFCEINKQLKTVKNIEFIHFKEGIVEEEVLIKNCFEEIESNTLLCDKCNTDKNKIKYDFDSKLDLDDNLNKINLYSNKSSSLCQSCLKLNTGVITKNNKNYSFKKGGLIFISLRLGINSISKEYYNSIKYLFNLPYNCGIIGGLKNSALYFIGESFDNLIYLDPHLNQTAVNDSQTLLNESEFFSYSAKYFYQCGINNISPAFTVAFMFKTLEEYNNLIENLNLYSSLQNPVFRIKNIESNEVKSKSSSKGIKIQEVTSFDNLDNLEDEYCFVDYEEDDLEN